MIVELFFLFFFIQSQQLECENELDNLYKTLCIDLTPQNQRYLAMKIMVCEYKSMGREFNHTSEINSNSFIQSLSDDYFDIWTNIYHGVERKCRKTVEKEQFERNLEKLSLIIEYVNLTISSLKSIQETNIAFINSQINISLEAQQRSMNIIQNASSILKSSFSQYEMLKRNFMNSGVYIMGIIFGIILSLVIPLMSRISIFLSLVWLIGTSYIPSNRVTYLSILFNKKTYIITYIIIVLCMLFFSVKNTYKIWHGTPPRNYRKWYS